MAPPFAHRPGTVAESGGGAGVGEYTILLQRTTHTTKGNQISTSTLSLPHCLSGKKCQTVCERRTLLIVPSKTQSPSKDQTIGHQMAPPVEAEAAQALVRTPFLQITSLSSSLAAQILICGASSAHDMLRYSLESLDQRAPYPMYGTNGAGSGMGCGVGKFRG